MMPTLKSLPIKKNRCPIKKLIGLWFMLMYFIFLNQPAYTQEIDQSLGGLRGRVFAENQPLYGASVVLIGTTMGTATDSLGTFRLSSILEGNYTLSLQFIGYEDFTQNITIVSGEVLDLGILSLKADATLLEGVEVVNKLETSTQKAALMMLRSERISSVLSAEGIEKLPDRNAAEAIRRMAGVVMESDQGEGRYISFRGTPTDWSSALVNGDRMPVANEEIEGRSLNFDVLPTSLIGLIENNQNLSPDIEGDAIGGSANFLTKEIPANPVLEMEIGGGYNQKAAAPLWNGSLLFSKKFLDNKLGVLIGGSLYDRNWSTDNYEIFYGNNDNHSIERLELRKYNGQRTTYGGNFKITYDLNTDHQIHALGFIGRMQDNEYNRKSMYNWVAGVGQSIRLQNINNIMNHQLYGGQVGGSHAWNDQLHMNWKVASYHASFEYGDVPFSNGDDRNGYFVIEFEQLVRYRDYLLLDQDGNVTDERNAFTRLKLLDIDSPIDGYGDPYDNIQPIYDPITAVKPSDTMFVFTKAFTEKNRHREQDPIVGQVDFSWKQSSKQTHRFGGKYRYKSGDRRIGFDAWQRNPFDPSIIVYDEFNPQDIPQKSSFLREIDSPYRNNLFQFMDDETMGTFLNTLGDERLLFLPFNENTPFYNQFVGSSYEYEEQVGAAYWSTAWRPSPKWSFNAGVRAEYTDVQVSADTVIEVIAENTRFLEERRLDRNYWAILPMLNARYAFTDKSQLRLAATRSFRRPNFNELKPGIPEIHYAHFHVLAGNPDLRPTYAWNVDLSYQQFFGLKGYFVVSAFYKYVVDHIFTTFESQDVDNNAVATQFTIPGGITAKRFENAPYANVGGIEVTLLRKLAFLPGFLRHLEVMLNYSYTASAMRIGAREELQPLPRQAKHVFNGRIGYESDRFSANLAVNYRDPFLMELNLFAVKDPNTGQPRVIQQNTDYDAFMGKNLTMDAAITFSLNDRLSLSAEANNLLNTPFVIYRGRRERPLQTEYYGLRGLIGLKYQFLN